MLLHKDAKIEAVCGKDQFRQNLASPYLDLTDKDDPRLVATDGHAMVALKVVPHEHDATGHVAIDALKALRKAGPRAEMVCNGSCAIPGGATYPRPDVGQFPEWRQVMPKEREGERVIAFDVHLLKRIVDACGGSGGVRLYFTDGMEPFRIHVVDAEAQHNAVLMPMVP